MSARVPAQSNWLVLGLVAIIAAAALGFFLILRTMPPRTVVMATGPEGSAYQEIGKRYQTLLARSGVQLQLVSTSGSIENLALLRDRHLQVTVALAQGGITSEIEAPQIESLGTLFYEPLWIFYRRGIKGQGLDALRGRRVSVGVESSGSRALSLEMLKRSGVDLNSLDLHGYSPQEASAKLLSGEIDAALMLISWEAPVVRRLLADDRVELASFPDTDALAALYPFLSKVVVPAGVGDIVKHLPPSNVILLATKASLVVRSDTHSAIQYLLLNTARQIHSGPSVFRRAGDFPAAEAIDVPLSDEAAQFYKSGRPFLQNYLPFWIASLVARLAVIIIPLVGLIYPLLRLLPNLYDWTMQRKISRLYGELRFLEDELETGSTSHDVALGKLNRLEQQANRLRVPATYASMQYVLRHHIGMVRDHLNVEHAMSKRGVDKIVDLIG